MVAAPRESGVDEDQMTIHLRPDLVSYFVKIVVITFATTLTVFALDPLCHYKNARCTLIDTVVHPMATALGGLVLF